MRGDVLESVSEGREAMLALCRTLADAAGDEGDGGKHPAADKLREEMMRLGFDEVLVDPSGNVVGSVGTGKLNILMAAPIEHLTGEGWEMNEKNGTVARIGDANEDGEDGEKAEAEDGDKEEDGREDIEEEADRISGPAMLAAMVNSGRAVTIAGFGDVFTLHVAGLVGRNSIKQLVDDLPVKPDAIVIGASTGGAIVRGALVRMNVVIETSEGERTGRSGVFSDSVISRMASIVKGLEQIDRRKRKGKALPRGRVILGSLETAIDDGKKMRLTLDCTLGEGETAGGALREIEKMKAVKSSSAAVRAALSGSPQSENEYEKDEKKALEDIGPWATAEDEILVLAAAKAGKKVFRRTPGVVVEESPSDPSLAFIGGRIPMICFGPGSGPDCTANKMESASMFYALLPGIMASLDR